MRWLRMCVCVCVCVFVCYVDCDPAGLVLVPNASTGINTVVQAVCKRLGPNDVITILNITYGK